MDYKFIILLMVVIGLILFFTRELENIKHEISKKLDNIAMCIHTSEKNTIAKMQYNLGTCVTKLKTLNGDYIEQVRKMNDYGSQPITIMSNNYTDTDSQGNNGMKFASLSDCKANKNQYVKQKPSDVQNNSFYISEDDIKSKSDKFKIKYDHANTSDQKNKLSPEERQQTSNLNPDFIDDDYNCITSESNNDSIPESNLIMQNSHIKEYDFNKDVENEEDDDDSVSASDGVSIEIDNKISSNASSKSSALSSSSSSVSNHSSNYESITFGSKKNKKQNDTNSILTANINVVDIDKNNLKNPSNYTLNTLKKIAKELSIPISFKDGQIRRQLKKDELYDKIKYRLDEKN